MSNCVIIGICGKAGPSLPAPKIGNPPFTLADMLVNIANTNYEDPLLSTQGFLSPRTWRDTKKLGEAASPEKQGMLQSAMGLVVQVPWAGE